MNYVKTNPDNSQLFLTSKDEPSTKIDDTDIKSSSSENLLRFFIDNKLIFNEYISKFCKRTLKIFEKYMTKDKVRTIMNAFFSCQFAYWSLIWMFHNRKLNNRINKLQERALPLVHNDNTSSLYELL